MLFIIILLPRNAKKKNAYSNRDFSFKNVLSFSFFFHDTLQKKREFLSCY